MSACVFFIFLLHLEGMTVSTYLCSLFVFFLLLSVCVIDGAVAGGSMFIDGAVVGDRMFTHDAVVGDIMFTDDAVVGDCMFTDGAVFGDHMFTHDAVVGGCMFTDRDFLLGITTVHSVFADCTSTEADVLVSFLACKLD
jgi:hypothetical protein